MKKLFMVCSAHLDPVWLWNWQEGAAAVIQGLIVYPSESNGQNL